MKAQADPDLSLAHRLCSLVKIALSRFFFLCQKSGIAL
jgi:hypothetical protein